MTNMLIPLFVCCLLMMSFVKKVNAYDAFITGVKDGMHLVTTIFPSLMAMILLVNLLESSGIFDCLSNGLNHNLINLPSEILAMCALRPVSGGASMAIMIQIFRKFGVDSLYGMMASIIQGSTDTTLYVIALYFSSVGIKKIKNALWIGLFADLVGISIAIFLTVHFF